MDLFHMTFTNTNWESLKKSDLFHMTFQILTGKV